MKTTRRTFLGGAAVASLPVAAGACVAVTAIQAEAAAPSVVAENPDLLAAYARLQDAQAELHAAKDALEWIADEWRHVWPLAPEELLGYHSADRHSGTGEPERDIIGRFLYRDAKGRRNDCFSVETSDDAQWWIDNFRRRKARGRTPETLRKSQEVIDRCLRVHERQLDLAIAYQKQTTELREAAGVNRAQHRLDTARNAFFDACSALSKIPAFGLEGLLIKAEAINATGYMDGFKRSEGVFGEMARFIQQVVDMGGRVSV